MEDEKKKEERKGKLKEKQETGKEAQKWKQETDELEANSNNNKTIKGK